MKLIKNIAIVKSQIKKIKRAGKIIGLVPTMGYLHDGHLSLIKAARKTCDIVVVSIFVNPTQFAQGEDYKKYPRDFKKDIIKAKKAGVDFIFSPSVSSMYPKGYKTYVSVNDLSKMLCGVTRPEHFKGVTSIVCKLFNIIEPDIAYFGQKDAQQAIIINRMIMDLNMNVKLKTLPIIRERDGLAMSSRNKYLNKADRKAAVVLYKALKEAKRLINSGVKDVQRLISVMRKIIKSAHCAKIDYISITDAKTLMPKMQARGKILIALAVYFGKIRLIDNIIISE